ncbi:MAG: hypothetical protein ASARMPREDX12_003908 [Alectoria sarmentosa]|nr:MAG: hypothetical protein ASARMPREDX12_003908 [Alectoria sarmentosa]
MSPIVNANGNKFVAVAIQYRLGAFGFLSSDEVMRYGAVNAGLLDQTFALHQVTIGGESAGAGSVMLQSLAFGGHLGDSLFSNVSEPSRDEVALGLTANQGIAASPYLPMQYGYADFVPSQSFYAFASALGCFGPPALPQSNTSASTFQCLVGKDTETLQNTSATISGSSRHGTWAFLPVTDGVFIQQLPSQQLLKKQVNGNRILVGSNANEGPSFTPQNIVTEDNFVTFLRNTFPLFTEDDIPRFTLLSFNQCLGRHEYTRICHKREQYTHRTEREHFWHRPAATRGQCLRRNDLRLPFLLARRSLHKQQPCGLQYQYSVVGAWHESDITSYFGPPTPNQGPDFNKAFMTIWGNFITQNNPSISASIANGVNGTGNGLAATDFPAWSLRNPLQLNLNETGGQAYSSTSFSPQAPNITEFEEPGLVNDFSVVDA